MGQLSSQAAAEEGLQQEESMLRLVIIKSKRQTACCSYEDYNHGQVNKVAAVALLRGHNAGTFLLRFNNGWRMSRLGSPQSGRDPALVHHIIHQGAAVQGNIRLLPGVYILTTSC